MYSKGNNKVIENLESVLHRTFWANRVNVNHFSGGA